MYLLSDLRTWLVSHKLKINDSKTEFLITSSQFFKVEMPNLTITVGDTGISSSDKARNFNSTFESFMNLEPHITQVCRVAYMHLSKVTEIRNMLTDEAASQLIHAFTVLLLALSTVMLFYMVCPTLFYLISNAFKTQLHEL